MSRIRFVTRLTGLSVEQAERLPRLASRFATLRPGTSLAVAALVALVAVACLPTPLPGTAARPTGFPTGDPPSHVRTTDNLDVAVPHEHPFDIGEGCFGPFDALMP